MKWLEDKGVEWGGILAHFPGQLPRAHHYAVNANTTGASIINCLLKFCNDSGVQILKQTRGRELLKDGEGNISGVVAETKDGEITINAKSAIIATGGLYGNEELIQKTIPYPLTYEEKEFIPWGLPHPGDGLQMAVDAGAARDGRILYEMHAPIFFGELRLLAYIVPLKHKAIWVNKNGERFADETIADLFAESANAMVRQPGKLAYCLFDQSIKKEIMEEGFSEFELAVGVMLPGGVPKNKGNPELLAEEFEKDLENEQEKGFAKIGNSWSEIAEYIGTDPATLEATIKEYNACCDKGHDDIFAKDREVLLPLRTPPFYAMKIGACINTVHGDIRCNHHMQVLNEQDAVIGGLYAAGVDTGGADWGTYNTHFTGHSFGFSINSGRIAGESAAQQLLGK
jgi:fumarate reductase flavoprotein subunit